MRASGARSTASARTRIVEPRSNAARPHPHYSGSSMSTQTRKDEAEAARERFERDTAEHEMTVIHDDGLYRHLRFQKPGSWIYGYDIVTWPGYLAITGDAGEYMFARLPDMFEFFAGNDRINPQYWAEKLRGPGYDTARIYSYQALRDGVAQWLED